MDLTEPQGANPLETKSGLIWRARGMVRTIRPHQWVKNVFVLAPVVFAKSIFDVSLIYHALSAFGIFCLIAGAVYTINDIADYDADRVHPKKRHRPIPSGQLPLPLARGYAAFLVAASVTASIFLGWEFLTVALGYLVINLAYSAKLKHLAYVDVSCISAGFVLRVMAGGFATGIYVSGYLLACTALLALFLGFGKRRHELSSSKNAELQRAALEGYSVRGLNVSLFTTGLATVLTYLVYTLDPSTEAFFNTPYLWPSTILVFLGVWRFFYLVRHRPDTESPTQEMLSDGPMVGIVLCWVAAVGWLVYHLHPGG
jgi:decaprenyl-phosphate phosphoribosyltransferase